MTRILIIGGHTDLQPAVAPLLAGGGYAVVGGSAETPLHQLVEREQPQALLVDSRRPGLDSTALVAAWRASSAGQRPVLVLAAAPLAADADADATLLAPWEPAELLATLRGLLRAGQRLADLRGRAARLDALARLLEAANSADDIPSLAPPALESMAQVVAGTRASLWLLDRNELVRLAPQRAAADGPPERRPLPAAAPVGQVVERGLPIYRMHPPEGEPAVLVPLVDDHRVIGVLQIDRAGALGLDERELVELLACHTARAFGRIQRSQQSALQCRRLELIDQKKDEYISLVSHELKNPMASIKGYSDLLLRRVRKTPDDPNRKGLEIISQQVGRMTGLLDQLLDFSRINTNRLKLDLEWVDLVAMLERVVEEMRSTTSKHRLCLEVEEPSLITSLDQLRIGQAIGNLVGNAIKYSPDGGTVTVRVERLDDGAHCAAVISVIDQGIGIPEQDRAHLFERFFRGSNVGSEDNGMGLGLFITREIVQQHGGQIAVESEEGTGTTFSITLPLVPASIEVM